MLRRLTALVLALCFGLFTAEALVADVHDGDATHAELAQFAGAVAHVDAPAGGHADGPGDHPGERAPGQSGHAQHACHCVHAHAGWWAPVAAAIPTPAPYALTVPGSSATMPASLGREPQLRPPIA